MRRLLTAVALVALVAACEKRTGEGSSAATGDTAAMGGGGMAADTGMNRSHMDTSVTRSAVQDTTVVKTDTTVKKDTVKKTDNAPKR